MAIEHFTFGASGNIASVTLNEQTDLIVAVDDAITAADTANVSNDATAEIAAIQTAVDAVEANQPSGAVVISVDLSLVTTKNQLRTILDAAAKYLTQSTNRLT